MGFSSISDLKAVSPLALDDDFAVQPFAHLTGNCARPVPR
jgi:hypothetical protein